MNIEEFEALIKKQLENFLLYWKGSPEYYTTRLNDSEWLEQFTTYLEQSAKK